MIRMRPTSTFVLPQMIRHRAELEPESLLIQEIGAGALTASEFHIRTRELAHALQEFGVGAEDCVASMVDASATGIQTWIASAWLRAFEVPINSDYRGATLSYTLNDCRASIMFTHDRCLEQIEPIAEELEHLRLVVLVDGVGQRGPIAGRISITSLAEFMDVDKTDEFTGPRESDPSSVGYTSGTTGPAKGVLRSWAGIHAAMGAAFPGEDERDDDDVVVYSPWAMFHASGKNSALAAVQFGGHLVQRRRFSLSSFWPDVIEHDCTHAMLMSVGALLWQHRQEQWRDNPLRRVFSIPLFPEHKKFEEYYGAEVSTGWGMTEIGLPLYAPRPDAWQSCGRIRPGYEIRLVDEYDQEVAPGEAGQLITRNARPWIIATKYLGNPEASADAWQNGWFHTGDLLRCDEDGNYYFVDRLKDYIRSRGHNVSSLEVEREAIAHSGVDHCAVIGVRPHILNEDGSTSEIVGDEDIKIFVVRSADSALTAEELFEFLEERLPRYMVPRFVTFIDDLPRTPTQKVRKTDLRMLDAGVETWDRLRVVL